MAISMLELGWVAGFLEGEGCFSAQGRGRRSFRVSAVQVQKEPLDRLQKLFGGRLFIRDRSNQTNRNNQPSYYWYLETDKSAQVMMTIYSLMSPVRKRQIERCLNQWRDTRILRKPGASVCIKGHSMEGWNVMPSATGVVCRLCYNERKLRYHRSRRQEDLIISKYIALEALT